MIASQATNNQFGGEIHTTSLTHFSVHWNYFCLVVCLWWDEFELLGAIGTQMRSRRNVCACRYSTTADR
jgi:hypothetical protein